MKDRVILDRGVVTGVIAERSFWPRFARLHVTLQDKIGIGWNFQVDGFAFHHFDRFAAQESGEQNFVEPIGQRSGGGKRKRGVAAERDYDRHLFVAFVITFAMTRAHFVYLPMHRGRSFIEKLHSINADVARAAFGIERVHLWERDESTAVFRPTFEDRKID